MLFKNIINSHLLDKNCPGNIFNRKVRLTSDCDFFPNFIIVGTFVDFIRGKNSVIKIRLEKNNRLFKVDAMMNNLDIEIING